MAPHRVPRPSRRQLLASTAALGAGLVVPRAFARDDNPVAVEERRLDEARREAIRRGCIYLAGENGEGGLPSKKGAWGKDDQGVVALTALTVLALMAHGSTDGRGPYGEAIRHLEDAMGKR